MTTLHLSRTIADQSQLKPFPDNVARRAPDGEYAQNGQDHAGT
jgi:hypothetical protein